MSCTKHVWYSEHGTYYRFKFILERAMSATHVAVILRTRTSPAYEEEFLKMDYPDVLQFHRNGYFSLTIVFFFYEYARGHFVLNGRVTFSGPGYFAFPFPVSRATGSCTRMLPSRLTCSFLPLPHMDCRLVAGYLFVLRFSLTTFSFQLVYAYRYRLCLSFCSLSTRLPSRYFWTLTHY